MFGFLCLAFNNGIIFNYGTCSGSATFALSFSNANYALTYSWTGSSDMDWVDRISGRKVSGFTIGENKGTKLYIAMGY